MPLRTSEGRLHVLGLAGLIPGPGAIIIVHSHSLKHLCTGNHMVTL